MKNSTKKVLALLMLVSVLVTSFIMSASAVTDTTGDYDFAYSGSNATINKKLTTSNDAIVFPDTVEYKGKSYSVTAIKTSFFTDSKSKTQYATAVRLPANLKSIEQATFNSYVSYITSIEIPGTITNCSDYFMGCNRLNQFIVNENNPNLKAVDGVLFKYSSTNTIMQKFPAAKKLDDSTTYEVPDGMTLIAYYAFYGSKYVTDVKVPASVTTIRAGAFCNSKITGVHLEDGTTFDPATYSCVCNSGTKCADRLKWCIEDEQEGFEPVCGTPGHTAGLRCDITGEWLSGEEIPAVGEHSWEVISTTDATCTENVVKTFFCSVCQGTKEEAVEDSALGHTGGTATCTVLAVCDRCNEPYGKTDSEKHSFTDYSYTFNEASCKENKKIYAKCDYGCTRIDVKEIEGTQLPHGETTVSKANQPAKCTIDGFERVIEKCKKCSTVISDTTTVIPALGHEETDPVISDEVAATCTEDGSYVSTVYCERCDYSAAKTVTVTALGHKETKPVITDEVPVTCTEDGSYVSTIYCENCDYSVSETVVVPSQGHAKKDPVKENEIAPTCTENGSYSMVVYCENCDYTESEAFVVPFTGHTKKAPVKENEIAPTCTENGSYSMVVYCENCDYTESKEFVVPFTGHTKKAPVKGNEIAPTCTENGSYTMTVHCENCDLAEVETISVSPLGHADDDGDYSCDNCGETLRSPADECDHMCHKDGIRGFFWKVIRFFQKLMKRNPVCECGVAHY